MGFLRSGYIVLGLANLMHWLHHIQLTLFALLCLLMSHKTSLTIYALYTLVYSLWCIVLISVFNKCENITTNLHENYWSFFIKKKYWNLQFSVKNCRKLLSFWFEWNFITVIVMILFIVWDLFYRVLISCLSKSLQPMLLLS